MADPAATLQKMIDGLKEKTGKSLEEWAKIAKAGGAAHGEIVAHLKKTGLTHGYANLVAHHVRASDALSQSKGGVDLVSQQYAGAKAGLKPIYDALVAKIQSFGPDVEISPKNAYVSLRRKKQFGLLQPSTATRLDVGLNLKGVTPKGRLEASGSFNSMCTHRVRVEDAKQVDKELVGWLKDAYDRAM